ncbi:hypothetical protein RR46_08079 [Papilio xuthus]|uniref:Uncharacterized protein n=1 Tax=Papilio xuthus TaxID=66420 RepID=A0A194Q9V9_PAPXU|nr:hypothetical protein RR46_08079 [Papilio xuthus]
MAGLRVRVSTPPRPSRRPSATSDPHVRPRELRVGRINQYPPTALAASTRPRPRGLQEGRINQYPSHIPRGPTPQLRPRGMQVGQDKPVPFPHPSRPHHPLRPRGMQGAHYAYHLDLLRLKKINYNNKRYVDTVLTFYVKYRNFLLFEILVNSNFSFRLFILKFFFNNICYFVKQSKVLVITYIPRRLVLRAPPDPGVWFAGLAPYPDTNARAFPYPPPGDAPRRSSPLRPPGQPSRSVVASGTWSGSRDMLLWPFHLPPSSGGGPSK